MRYQSVMYAVLAGTALSASAQQINVSFENTQDAGGFTFSPFWLGLSDGSFNLFDSGAMASSFDGIEQIAELANGDALSARFGGAQPGGVQATLAEGGAHPTFEPGEAASMSINTMGNRYLDYAAMVVPSNDMFVGSLASVELFDAMGHFNGPITIDIFGSTVWDAGTEVNDPSDGVAFIDGSDATLGTDENGVIALILPGGQSYLDSFVGMTTATGPVITQSFGEQTHLGRITITPAPASAALIGFGLLGAARRRR